MWTCLRSVILKLQRFPGILSGCMARLWHGLHRQETRKISTIGTEGLNFQTCQKRDNIWNVVHTWLTLSLHNMLTIRWGGTIEHLEKHKLWKERNHRRKFYRHMLSPKMFFARFSSSVYFFSLTFDSWETQFLLCLSIVWLSLVVEFFFLSEVAFNWMKT